jgi:diguanylate cyclase (GGDEF)-like protein
LARAEHAGASAHGWSSRRRSALIALAVGLAYLGLSQYVLWLNDPVGAGAGFWPAAGVSLAAMLAIPTRHWWMVAVAVGTSELGGNLAQGYPLLAASCWAVANALEPVVGAALVRRFASYDGRLTTLRNVAVLVLGGALAAPALSGLVGGFGTVTALDASWLQVWPKWVAGDGLGVLVMAPVVLSWPYRHPRRLVETAALGALVVAGTVLGFRNWGASWDVLVPYLTLPGMLWAAVRFGPWGAALAGCVTAHAANIATAYGYGPFALQTGPDNHTTTLLQVFLAITITTALLLAALSANLTERVDVERLLAHEAAHDSLTGLPNRRELARRLDAALAESHPAQGVGLLFIDLDRFKVINDSLGHDWGDILLTRVAERLRTGARPRDVVARLGGDEFVVLCTHLADPAEAGEIARRLLDAVSEPVQHAGRTVAVSASIGIATTEGAGMTGDEVLRDADAAMYRAKRDGRARVEFFNADLRQQAVRRLQVEVELREALRTGQLEVHYQPITDAASREVVALEALVRWQHPRRGLLLPQDFLDVAEDSGLIRPLGEFVIATALTELARLPDPLVCMSINVAASQLDERDGVALDDLLLATCAAVGVDPGRVWVELTETAVLDSLSAVEVLHRVHGAGARLALDDFGTGYASLSQLDRIPFDIVKIDRSFSRRLGVGDVSAERRMSAIVSIIHSYDMTAVSEGIETGAQEAAARRAGCDLAQGFLLGRPAAVERATGLAGTPPVSSRGPAEGRQVV